MLRDSEPPGDGDENSQAEAEQGLGSGLQALGAACIVERMQALEPGRPLSTSSQAPLPSDLFCVCVGAGRRGVGVGGRPSP